MSRAAPIALLCITCDAILAPADPDTSRLFIPIHQDGRPDRHRCAACARELGPLIHAALPIKRPLALAIVTALRRVLAWLRVPA
jgi:hypothetical protein